ncbi:MAG: 23S rRNA (guanosine(2251)-2'-O)-methyltransferase RlmB, partial [Actinobacteria bacterium]|nr:23S rRNA (guanosine(2251)-2'-O)-methyltransferase RlmB [Actinomycetota bacterium]
DTIAGRNAVVEALRAGLPAKELVVAIGVDIDERLEESVKLAQKMGLGIREVERRQIENMTGIANHQGIALVAKPFQYSSQKEIFARAKEPALFVAVDGVTDPRNIGAIARSAAAFGADGLLIPERRNAPLTAAAWKSSAGAAARLPIAQVTNLVRSMQDAKEFGCFIVGLDGDADTAVEEIEIADQPIYMVVGSEGRGLSRLVRENCDLLIKIPMSNTVESLNASVAMSIALYAVDRKRHAI